MTSKFQEGMERFNSSNITEKMLKNVLTLSQKTNFRLFQTERACRRQFQISNLMKMAERYANG